MISCVVIIATIHDVTVALPLFFLKNVACEAKRLLMTVRYYEVLACGI